MTRLDQLNTWCARWTRHELFLPFVVALTALNFIFAVVLAKTGGPDWLWIVPALGCNAGAFLLWNAVRRGPR